MPELLADLSRSIPELIRAEIALLKAQAREKAGLAGQGAGLVFAALIFLSMAIATGTALMIIVLDLFLPLWLAALIITLLWLLIAAALGYIGVLRFKKLTADGEGRPPAPGSGKPEPGRGKKKHASTPGGRKPAPKRGASKKSAPATPASGKASWRGEGAATTGGPGKPGEPAAPAESDARAEAPRADTRQDSPASPADETAAAPGQEPPAEPHHEQTAPEGGAGQHPEPGATTAASEEEEEA